MTMLLSLALAGAAVAKPTFDVRITVRSECSVQQPLFGRSAQGTASVICNPGATPFQSHAIFLDNIEELAGVSSAPDDFAIGGGHDTSHWHLSRREQLPIPMSQSNSPYSRMIFVIF